MAAGAIELTSNGCACEADLTISSATLTNAAGATLSSLVGDGGARTITGQLANQGTLTVGQPLTLNTNNGTDSNSGTINLTTGSLTINLFSSTFNNTGTMTIGSGDTLQFNGGTLNYRGGSVGGTGTLAISSGLSANVTPDFSNPTTTLTVHGATINGPGTITNASSLTLYSGTINAALVNNGTVVSQFGDFLNGSVTTTSASIIRLQPFDCGETIDRKRPYEQWGHRADERQ